MSFVDLNNSGKPNSRELFLDTSIHCAKLKGPHFQSRIRSVLEKFFWRSSSTYTKVEFGNVVLSRVEYYLNSLEKFNSLDATIDWIGNVLQDKRHSAIRTWSFNLLVKHSRGDDFEATERARLYLTTMMTVGVGFVDRLCDTPLANGTDCYWAKRGVQKSKDGTLKWQSPKCERTNKRCRLDEFFVENKEEFIKIKAAIDQLPAEKKSSQLSDFSDIIDRALNDPGILLDYKKGCKKLADAIIAVDSKQYRCLFSQNIAESELLTAVLGQDFYYLPSNPGGGVKVKAFAVVASPRSQDATNGT